MNESPVQDGSADILIYTCWCTSFLNAYKQTDHTFHFSFHFTAFRVLRRSPNYNCKVAPDL